MYWTCLNSKFSGDDIADCSCVIRLGTNSTSLKPTKEGLCNYTLQTSPGSQVSFPPLISRFNFTDLRQLSPPKPSLTEPGGRVRVVGEPRRRSSIVGKLNRFLNNKISKSAYLCLGPKRFCGLTVPNYPGPSVITSSSNSIVLSYNLPADSLAQGHSFQVEKKLCDP